MSKRKMIGLLMCILLLGSIIAGCVEQQQVVEEVEVPQEVVAGLGRDAGGVYGAAHHHPPLTRLFEMLVTTGFEAEIIPQLTTSWEVSDDELTWTFYLREGVKFHDSTPFNTYTFTIFKYFMPIYYFSSRVLFKILIF